MTITVTAFAVCAVGCPIRVTSGPTDPVNPLPPIAQDGAKPQLRFRNLTHPTISPYWARAKADGEPKALNYLTAPFGINWIPVVIGNVDESTRVEKETVCGPLKEAELFIGDEPTTEYDWNLKVAPRDTRFIDIAILSRNAKRVRDWRVNLSTFFERSGKYLNTCFWHHDRLGTYLLEVEVSAHRKLLSSDQNPFPCVGGPCRLEADRPRFQQLVAPKDICAYGPWVQEAMHGFRPEIHPAEAIYWTEADGTIHLLILQDASRRFDASRPGAWLTPFGPAGGPQTKVRAEHWVQEWVQEAMIGEFVVPLGGPGDTRDVVVIEEKGLEAIGSGEYPKRADPAAGSVQVPSDQRLQVVKSTSGPPMLTVRAQIRGAPKAQPLHNEGSYVLLRISPGTSPR